MLSIVIHTSHIIPHLGNHTSKISHFLHVPSEVALALLSISHGRVRPICASPLVRGALAKHSHVEGLLAFDLDNSGFGILAVSFGHH